MLQPQTAHCIPLHNSTSFKASISAQGPAGATQGNDAEAQAELEALRRERALLIDKLNNHPDVRKYAGKHLQSPSLEGCNRMYFGILQRSLSPKIMHVRCEVDMSSVKGRCRCPAKLCLTVLTGRLQSHSLNYAHCLSLDWHLVANVLASDGPVALCSGEHVPERSG